MTSTRKICDELIIVSGCNLNIGNTTTCCNLTINGTLTIGGNSTASSFGTPYFERDPSIIKVPYNTQITSVDRAPAVEYKFLTTADDTGNNQTLILGSNLLVADATKVSALQLVSGGSTIALLSNVPSILVFPNGTGFSISFDIKLTAYPSTTNYTFMGIGNTLSSSSLVGSVLSILYTGVAVGIITGGIITIYLISAVDSSTVKYYSYNSLSSLNSLNVWNHIDIIISASTSVAPTLYVNNVLQTATTKNFTVVEYLFASVADTSGNSGQGLTLGTNVLVSDATKGTALQLTSGGITSATLSSVSSTTMIAPFGVGTGTGMTISFDIKLTNSDLRFSNLFGIGNTPVSTQVSASTGGGGALTDIQIAIDNLDSGNNIQIQFCNSTGKYIRYNRYNAINTLILNNWNHIDIIIPASADINTVAQLVYVNGILIPLYSGGSGWTVPTTSHFNLNANPLIKFFGIGTNTEHIANFRIWLKEITYPQLQQNFTSSTLCIQPSPNLGFYGDTIATIYLANFKLWTTEQSYATLQAITTASTTTTITSSYQVSASVDAFTENVPANPLVEYLFNTNADTSGNNFNLTIGTTNFIIPDIDKGGALQLNSGGTSTVVLSNVPTTHIATVGTTSCCTGMTISFDFKFVAYSQNVYFGIGSANLTNNTSFVDGAVVSAGSPTGLIFRLDGSSYIMISYVANNTNYYRRYFTNIVFTTLLKVNDWNHIDIILSSTNDINGACPALYINGTYLYLNLTDGNGINGAFIIVSPVNVKFFGALSTSYFANFRVWLREIPYSELEVLNNKTQISPIIPNTYNLNTSSLQLQLLNKKLKFTNIERYGAKPTFNVSIFKNGTFPLSADASIPNYIPLQYYKGDRQVCAVSGLLAPTSTYNAIGTDRTSVYATIQTDTTYCNIYQLSSCNNRYDSTYGYLSSPRFPLAISSSSNLCNISLSYIFKNSKTESNLPQFDTQLAIGMSGELEKVSPYDIMYTSLNNITITKMAIGQFHTIFLGTTSKGLPQVYGCGLNSSGQLGLGDAIQRQYPIEITALRGCNITDISAGNVHTIYLSSINNRVYASGASGNGRMGTGNTSTYSTPTVLTTLSGCNITKISTSVAHTLFLSTLCNTVYGCGCNGDGRIGLGTSGADVLTPILLPNLSWNGTASCNITHISVGLLNSMFLSTTCNMVYISGANTVGQIGNGTAGATLYPIPQVVPSLSWNGTVSCNITDILSGGWDSPLPIGTYSIFLSATCNRVYACGANQYGQLGIGNTIQQNTPVVISNLSGCNITNISGGAYHTYFLSGTCNILYATGCNNVGQIGNGTINTQYLTPQVVSNLSNNSISHLAQSCVSAFHMGVILNDGKPYLWGLNGNYQMGQNWVGNLPTPSYQSIFEKGPVKITQVSIGFFHTLFLGTVPSGALKVYGCGNNANGQLGDNTTTSKYYPVESVALNGLNITNIVAGNDVSLFLSTIANVIYGCGLNAYGQLGVGNTSAINTLTTVSSGLNITQIAMGGAHSLFLSTTDNKVYGCGYNLDGRIGDNSLTTRLSIVVISNLTNCNITNVSGGEEHSLFVSSSGNKVYGCGNNVYGTSGDGTTTQRSSPVVCSNLTGCNIIKVSCGRICNVFLSSTGIVYSCGYNENGQLGLGNYTNYSIPTVISGLLGCNITDISTGENNSFFISSTCNLLYSSGYVPYCGITDTYGGQSITFPKVVDALSNQKIQSLSLISGNSRHCSVITTSGIVCMWGENGYGQLGLGDTLLRHYPAPFPVEAKSIQVSKIAIGTSHTIFLSTNAYGVTKVYTSGCNNVGQLGIGNTIQQNTPVEILSGCNITDISAGCNHSIFLSATCNIVYGCGTNANGEIGRAQSTIPAVISILTNCNITSVSAGQSHTLFLSLNYNRVYGTGLNTDGRVGNNTTSTITTPVVLPNLINCNITKISAGDAHSIFLSTNLNIVYGCGINGNGQIGDGSITQRIAPVVITALRGCNITDISAGQKATIFLARNNDILYATGCNANGQLGVGNTTQYNTPTVITALRGCNITDVSIGANYSLFLSSNNKQLYGTGCNLNNQLGDGTITAQYLTPIAITSMSNANISQLARLQSVSSHSGLTTTDGNIFVWGNNFNGQLGLGDTTNRTTPTPYTATLPNIVSGMTFDIFDNNKITITKMAFGQYYSLFLGYNSSGISKVYSVGYNGNGQLGLGDTLDRRFPVEITILTGCNITDISAGLRHSVFLSTTNNTVYSCGLNQYGALGYNTTVNCNTPTVVSNVYNCNITNISCGSYHTLFVSSTGNRVYACGYNTDGVLGVGDQSQRNLPVVVQALTGLNIVKCSGGNSHSLFVSSTNLVYASGYNLMGTLGLGNNGTPVITATNVPLLTGCNITDVYAGGYEFSYFLSATQNVVYSCGRNDNGQLGLGNTTSNNSPQVVRALIGCNISSISALWINAVFYSTINNCVYAVGYNTDRQLANGNTTQLTTPIVVSALNNLNISSLLNNSSSALHLGLITADGNAFVWGYNGYGQLGLDDTITTRVYPEQVPIIQQYPVKVTKVSFSQRHTVFLATTPSGATRVFSVGYNGVGQLGLNDTTARYFPVEITSLFGCNITDVNTCGTNTEVHTIFVSSTCNRVYGCGANNYSQLGDGTTTQRNFPIEITSLRGCNITNIICGNAHTIFLSKTSNILYGCGYNGDNGGSRIGVGTTGGNITRPVVISNLTGCNITNVATGDFHILFLSTTNKVVYSAGVNGNGQLGLCNTTNYSTPQVVTALTGCNIINISASAISSIFISPTTVYGCGWNNTGLLGTGNTTQYTSPTVVPNLTNCNITSAYMGQYHTIFASLCNIVYATGCNNIGQLGDTTTTQRLSPVVSLQAPSPIQSLAEVSCYSYSSGVVLTNGTVYMWGNNANGQLGDTTTTNRLVPTIVASNLLSFDNTTISVSLDTTHTTSGLSTVVIPNYQYVKNAYHRFDVSMSNNILTCYLDGFPSNKITLSRTLDVSTNPNIRIFQRAGKTSQQFGQLKVWDKPLNQNDFYRASLSYSL